MGVIFYTGARIFALLGAPLVAVALLLGFVFAGVRPPVVGLAQFVGRHRQHPAAHA